MTTATTRQTPVTIRVCEDQALFDQTPCSEYNELSLSNTQSSFNFKYTNEITVVHEKLFYEDTLNYNHYIKDALVPIHGPLMGENHEFVLVNLAEPEIGYGLYNGDKPITQDTHFLYACECIHPDIVGLDLYTAFIYPDMSMTADRTGNFTRWICDLISEEELEHCYNIDKSRVAFGNLKLIEEQKNDRSVPLMLVTQKILPKELLGISYEVNYWTYFHALTRRLFDHSGKLIPTSDYSIKNYIINVELPFGRLPNRAPLNDTSITLPAATVNDCIAKNLSCSFTCNGQKITLKVAKLKAMAESNNPYHCAIVSFEQSLALLGDPLAIANQWIKKVEIALKNEVKINPWWAIVNALQAKGLLKAYITIEQKFKHTLSRKVKAFFAAVDKLPLDPDILLEVSDDLLARAYKSLPHESEQTKAFYYRMYPALEEKILHHSNRTEKTPS